MCNYIYPDQSVTNEDKFMEEKLLKIDETASLLNVSCSAIRKWISQKKIPVTRLGKAIRIKKSFVEEISNRGLDEAK